VQRVGCVLLLNVLNYIFPGADQGAAQRSGLCVKEGRLLELGGFLSSQWSGKVHAFRASPVHEMYLLSIEPTSENATFR
jgi:hypothetical protein